MCCANRVRPNDASCRHLSSKLSFSHQLQFQSRRPCRTWLPEQAVYKRPLHFDYNATHAVATAQFIKWHQSPTGHMLAPKFAKFLKDGQNVRVHHGVGLSCVANAGVRLCAD